MLRKFFIASLLAGFFAVAGCHHTKVQNPIANISSKQPDKVLFDRAMDSMNKARYTEARTLLDTLLQTYPESEYVARAKLAKGDAWYAEGGTAGLQQAEVEYKDFETFFPNMPEAAEAQFKVAEIHYRQMEKPDRDFTQAMRAADEYKIMIQQYPDSKLIPKAKQRLREVQEVLAERQWRIARFYFLRNNMAASQARLTSLTDSYPLFSGADEALFMLGTIYEKEAAGMRAQKKVPEVLKAKLAAEYDQKAIDAYSRLITRYPIMGLADDARKQLQAMRAPVPTPTAQAIAQNQAEEDSRGDITRFHELVDNFRKHPDVSKSADVGDPTMEEEQIASAPALLQHLNAEIKEASATVGTGPAPAPGANQPPPNSSTPQPAAQPATQPASGAANVAANPPAAQPAAAASSSDLPVITPNAGSTSTAAPDSTAKAANTAGTSAANTSTAGPSAANSASGSAPVPARVNEIGVTPDNTPQNGTPAAQNSQQQNANDQQDSSSKKKKKKGLHKLIPF